MDYIKKIITLIPKVPKWVWLLLVIFIFIFGMFRLGYVGKGMDKIAELIAGQYSSQLKLLQERMKFADEKIKILEKANRQAIENITNLDTKITSLRKKNEDLEKKISDVDKKISDIVIPDTVSGVASELRKAGIKSAIPAKKGGQK